MDKSENEADKAELNEVEKLKKVSQPLFHHCYFSLTFICFRIGN